jgi:hypothetical protein
MLFSFKPKVLKHSKLSGIDLEHFVTKQLFFKSGQNNTVSVPMFIVHRKVIKNEILTQMKSLNIILF